MSARDGLFVVGAAGAGQTSPTEARLALAGLVAGGTGGVDARAGIFWGAGNPLAVTGTSATGTMTYAVAAGNAVANRGTSLGPYLMTNDAAATAATTTAPGSGSRYDLIWIRQPDAEQGDANSVAVLGVTQGTASGSPTKPYASVPAGALVLAEALMPSGTTRTDTGVTITNVAPYTAAAGAAVPVRNSTERSALTAFDGLTARRLDSGLDEISDGTSWTIFGALTVLGQTTPLKLAYGSTVGTVSPGGDFTVATGLTTVLGFIGWNGDGVTRSNITVSRSGTSGGQPVVRSRVADTGALVTSGLGVRVDWIAIGT